MSIIISTRRIHLTAEGEPVTPEDPRGIELLVGKGSSVDTDRLTKHGITWDADGNLTFPSEAKKARKAAPENKDLGAAPESKVVLGGGEGT